MNNNFMLRGIETGVALVASYLSAIAFLNSSLYDTTKDIVTNFLGRVPLTASMTPSSINEALTQVIIASTLILTVYMLLRGVNRLILYSVNSFLLFTEIIGYSSLDWLNLIGNSYTAFDKRPILYPLISCLFVMMGYILLLVGNEVDTGIKVLIKRGAQVEAVEEINFKQSGLLTAFTFASSVIALGIFYLSPTIEVAYNFLANHVAYNYLILGLFSVIIIAISLVIYLKIYSK